MGTFKLGINMAGAVSAGAYTAGVLDFLTEALDEWYKAKAAGEPVPKHDISLEVITGASAGGMCAAIAACQLHDDFDHIVTAEDAKKVGTDNKFYEGWVNQIDIRKLLTARDLKGGKVMSLLDSTVIADIAENFLRPGGTFSRPYVSKKLSLFLTLTNLRGIPYGVYEDPTHSEGPDEQVTYHADRLRFQLADNEMEDIADDSVRLLRQEAAANDTGWSTLQTAAMATGAFPIALSSRTLQRRASDFLTRPPWQPICSDRTDPPKPEWPSNTDSFYTVNVDGGMINNSPFALNYDYLATLEPKPEKTCTNAGGADKADRAVLTVAPFPAVSVWDKDYQPAKNDGLLSVAGQLISAIISQARFYGEALAMTTSGDDVYNRFFIAPSGPILNPNAPVSDQSALQCGSFGAFGGFLERSFRAHDFLLGRRNCQEFLRNRFILPRTNATVREGLPGLTDEQLKQFAPQDPAHPDWIPIIPLCGTAKKEATPPELGTITEKSVDEIVELIYGRIDALLPFMAYEFRSKLLKLVFPRAVRLLLSWFGGKAEIKAYLIRQLGSAFVKA